MSCWCWGSIPPNNWKFLNSVYFCVNFLSKVVHLRDNEGFCLDFWSGNKSASTTYPYAPQRFEKQASFSIFRRVCLFFFLNFTIFISLYHINNEMKLLKITFLRHSSIVFSLYRVTSFLVCCSLQISSGNSWNNHTPSIRDVPFTGWALLAMVAVQSSTPTRIPNFIHRHPTMFDSTMLIL